MVKQMRLPKAKTTVVGPEDAHQRIDGDDVEGHGLPTTPPPSIRTQRGTEHGGEFKTARGVKTRN